MNNQELNIVSEHDKEAIARILSEEIYPRTVKEIRGKLKHTGRDLPEYIITRTLRSLLSEGKVRFRGGRWMSNDLYGQAGVIQTGFTSRNIERPRLSQVSEEVFKTAGSDLRSPKTNAQKNDRDSSKSRSIEPWGTFRSLLSYYEECIRNEEGADASAFIEDIGKKYLFANGIGNWYPKTGESWSYVIPMGPHVADFVQNLSRNALDNIVVLGYPIEAVCIKHDDQPDTKLIRPVFQYILKAPFTNNSINLSTVDAQPEISLEWMKYSLKSYSEQYHFLSHCGLINQRRPVDEPLGFTSDDIRPDLDELVKRLYSFMPKNIIEPLNCRSVNAHALPSGFKKGIYNKAVIMIGNRTKYTQTLLKELTEIESQSDETLDQTALKYLFKNGDIDEEKTVKNPHEESVADAVLLNSEQREAVSSLLTENISVVTGPPGTGKSQVVMGTVANARLQAQSVLFASRNHKAIDAVVDRLRDSQDRPLIIRTNSKNDPNLKYTFRNAIDNLLSTNIDIEAANTYKRKLSQLKQLLKKRGEHAIVLDQIRSLRDKIGQLEWNIAWLREELSEPLLSQLEGKYSEIDKHQVAVLHRLTELSNENNDRKTVINTVINFLSWIRIIPLWISTKSVLKLFSLESMMPTFPPLGVNKISDTDLNTLRRIKNFIDWKHHLLPLETNIKQLPLSEELIEDVKNISEDIKALASDLLTLHVQSHIGIGLLPDGDHRENLSSLNVALRQFVIGFENQRQHNEAKQRLLEYTPILLENFPSWAVTNLSVGTRIPLAQGIFDLAIIDEASQCDIASAIPILFRSKRAAVVGDPNQLRHVTKLTIGKDSLLRKRAGLTELDDMRYSYRETSLYNLFAQTNTTSPHLLRETYRSFSEIAEYSNLTFYNGMLRVATDERGLKVPANTNPGIHWTEVVGPVVNAGRSGCVSESEVVTIYELVKTILVENNFRGTLGVVTPFRQQQKRIHDRIFDSDIPFEQLTHADFIVDTAHGFQGDEKDVMIYSLCAGPEMPSGSLHFIRDNGNLFNVAVSRARAVLHVVGNRDWAKKSGINHIVQLAQTRNQKTSDADSGPWSPHESPWEKILYEALLSEGIETMPQYPVAGRRLDLALINKKSGLKVDIEVDSDRYHRNPDGSRKKDDTWRDIYLMGLGWKIMRFWVYNLRDNIGKCVSKVEKVWREHE